MPNLTFEDIAMQAGVLRGCVHYDRSPTAALALRSKDTQRLQVEGESGDFMRRYRTLSDELH